MKGTASLLVVTLAAALGGCASTSGPSPETGSPGATVVTATPTDGRAVGGADPHARDLDRDAPSSGPDLKRSVYYEFDHYDVRPQYRELVESHARWLKANPQARLTIIGNTDEQGTREYNLALGQRRAESVSRLLTMLGARAEQIEAISFGKEKPRAAGHDEAAWAENRRSDFARP